MASFFMNLTLPKPTKTAASTWATNLNTLFTAVDAHNHISNSGQRITPAGIGVDSTLSMATYGLTDLGSKRFTFNTAPSVDNELYSDNGNLAFRDDNSVEILLTSGGSLAISAGLGIIKGDYSSSGATLFYTDSNKTYYLQDSLGNPAAILADDIVSPVVSGVDTDFGDLQAGAANITTLNLQDTTTISGDMTLSGNTTGRGIIPVGGVVALASNLAGVSLPSSMLELNGQTISDATSPMNGVTLPNVSNSLFLMGSSTAGTSGGAATYTITSSNMTAHTHSINNSHSNTFGISNTGTTTSSHTHNIAHAHQHILRDSSPLKEYSLTSVDDSVSSLSTSNVHMYTWNPNNSSDSAGTSAMGRIVSTGTLYTTGALSPPTGSDGSTATSDTPSATQVVTLSGSVTSLVGNSSSIGSGTSISLLPNYITTKYVMRYK